MGEDEYESALVLVLDEHRRLAGLDPSHDLLKYGAVRDGDEVFVYNRDNLAEAEGRFAKDGAHPRGVNACTYMLAQHFVALKDATNAVEAKRSATTH